MSVSEEFWEVDNPGNFNNKGGRYMKINLEEDRAHSGEEIERLAENAKAIKSVIREMMKREMTPEQYAEFVADSEMWEEAEHAISEYTEDIAAAREARKEPGRIPNYYLMPNCVEVKEIARYLTSNGGQAVQYIARATRTDGIIKGNPISDLEKARDMIEDEINRLKETN